MSDTPANDAAVTQQTTETAAENNTSGKRNDANERIRTLISERDTIKTQFDDVNKRLLEFENAKKSADDDAALKRGEHEKVIGERDTTIAKLTEDQKVLAERMKRFETWMKARVDKELEPLTEAQRNLVPPRLDFDEQLEWLTNAREAGVFGGQPTPPAPNLHSQQTTTSSSAGVPDINDPKVAEALKKKYRMS